MGEKLFQRPVADSHSDAQELVVRLLALGYHRYVPRSERGGQPEIAASCARASEINALGALVAMVEMQGEE